MRLRTLLCTGALIPALAGCTAASTPPRSSSPAEQCAVFDTASASLADDYPLLAAGAISPQVITDLSRVAYNIEQTSGGGSLGAGFIAAGNAVQALEDAVAMGARYDTQMAAVRRAHAVVKAACAGDGRVLRNAPR